MKRLLATALVLVLGAAVAGCGSDSGASDDNGLSSVSSYTDVPGEPLGPASQTVRETDGSSWSYDEASGLTLLYFGYTRCPDVCPMTMADLATALRNVPSDVADQVTVKFVSTDPNRDTMKQLRSWLGGFDPDFVGARAPIKQVVRAAESYGVSVEPPEVSKDGYEVSHGTQVLVLRPGGGAVGYFSANAGPRAYEKALPQLVEELG